jgi:hypothetical protein
MVDPADASKIIGDPTEKIMAKGNVNEAAGRLPYNALPEYVYRDKQDARGEIDNIFGANAALRGETTKAKTLGEQVLSQRANMGRLQPLTDSLEDAADKLYKGLTQLIKVFWDETQMVRFTNSEGKTQFIDWDRDKIEDGVKIRVKAGSMLPKDKQAIRNETIQLAPVLDPLSLAEGLDKPDPKGFAKRLVYYRFFMDKYLAEILEDNGEGGDAQAMADVQALVNGQDPQVPDAPSKEYLATLQQFIQSQGFVGIQDPATKQRIIEFARMVNENAKKGIGEGEGKQTPETPQAPAETGQEEVIPEGTTPPAGGEQPRQNLIQRVLSKIRGQ